MVTNLFLSSFVWSCFRVCYLLAVTKLWFFPSRWVDSPLFCFTIKYLKRCSLIPLVLSFPFFDVFLSNVWKILQCNKIRSMKAQSTKWLKVQFWTCFNIVWLQSWIPPSILSRTGSSWLAISTGKSLAFLYKLGWLDRQILYFLFKFFVWRSAQFPTRNDFNNCSGKNFEYAEKLFSNKKSVW